MPDRVHLQFPTEEEERLLDRTFEFEKQCRDAAGGRKSVITMVISSEGRLVLATRFFRPIPLPEEVLQDVPASVISVLVRIYHNIVQLRFRKHSLDIRPKYNLNDNDQMIFSLFQRRVAAFVSLIPVLPFPSDVGDCGDMWFTSEVNKFGNILERSVSF